MPAAAVAGKDDLRATVKERSAAVAASPGQEKKLPVGPAGARKPGYEPQEIDALPPSVPGPVRDRTAHRERFRDDHRRRLPKHRTKGNEK